MMGEILTRAWWAAAAIRAIYRKHGGRIADGIPGPITAAALGIPAHP